MKTPDYFKIFLMLFVMGTFMACSDDDGNNEPNEILITQSQLDGANNFLDDFTGGAFPHGGPDGTTGDQTLRYVYSSLSALSGTVSPGTIVTKKTFAKDDNGNPTDLYVSFVMVKREAGYDPDNKDWEYMMIPFDDMNDYMTKPFGTLPNVSAANRGKLANCISCHSGAGGSDYLFVND